MIPKIIRWGQIRHHWEIYLFIIPTLISIGLFQYYPASSGIFHSFFRWNGAEISEFVGWDNYLSLIKSRPFWESFKVAFLLGGWNIVKMIPAILVAVCIHRCRSSRMQFFYRAMFVIPMVIPSLVIVLVWRSFFFEATSGYLNQFLQSTGLYHLLAWLDAHFHWGGIFVLGQMPAWLGDPRLILTAGIVWGFPWVGSAAVLIHLAKLQGISKDIYEAAEIDGIGWWSKFTRIELPLMMGSVYLMLVFAIIGTIQDGGMVIALAGIEGGPGGKLTVPALFMIRKAFVEQQMGYACAVGIILTIVILVFQKLCTLMLNWGSLGRVQKLTIRVISVIVGLIFVFCKAFVPIGAALILIAFPYADGWKLFSKTVLKKLSGETAEKHNNQISVNKILEIERRIQNALEREHTLWFRTIRYVEDGFLRLGKHLVIWLVLASALIPLYLMVVVSLKSNHQFYEKPAAITQPYHWENWRTGWETIAPTVTNSIFISTSSTVIMIALSLCAAYFFARARMPTSNFFWNAILILMMIPAIANLVPLFRLLRDMNLLNTLFALIIVGASGGQIAAIFILRNFMADIPQDLFDAAEIDGANHFQQLKLIVLPLSGPILGTVGVQNFLVQWNDFVLPLIIIRDQERLPVMVQLLRLAGEYIKFWGPLMAGYAIASIPIIILFIFSMKLFIKGLTEGAVKG